MTNKFHAETQEINKRVTKLNGGKDCADKEVTRITDENRMLRTRVNDIEILKEKEKGTTTSGKFYSTIFPNRNLINFILPTFSMNQELERAKGRRRAAPKRVKSWNSKERIEVLVLEVEESKRECARLSNHRTTKFTSKCEGNRLSEEKACSTIWVWNTLRRPEREWSYDQSIPRRLSAIWKRRSLWYGQKTSISSSR